MTNPKYYVLEKFLGHGVWERYMEKYFTFQDALFMKQYKDLVELKQKQSLRIVEITENEAK